MSWSVTMPNAPVIFRIHIRKVLAKKERHSIHFMVTTASCHPYCMREEITFARERDL